MRVNHMAEVFNERKKGFEAKFKMDEEMEFKVSARRNKLLGLWLAEKLGLSESEHEGIKNRFNKDYSHMMEYLKTG